ncbi:hypothetical protein AYI69_g3071, partial [Smittium culicis]
MRRISRSLKRARSVLFRARTEDSYSPSSSIFSHNKLNSESIQIPNPSNIPQTEFTINIIDEEEYEKSVCINVKDFSSENRPSTIHADSNKDFYGFRFPEKELSLENNKFKNSNITKCQIYEPNSYKAFNENSQKQIDNNADTPHLSILLDGNNPSKKCENDNSRYKQNDSSDIYNRPKGESFLKKVKKRISRTSKSSFFLNKDDFCNQKSVENDTSCDQSLFELSENPSQNREFYDFSLETNKTRIDSGVCKINRSRSEEYLDNICISQYDFDDSIRASTIECDQISLIINAKSDIGIFPRQNKPIKYKSYTLFETYKELMVNKIIYSSINDIDHENGNPYSVFGECRPEYNPSLSENTFKKILLKEKNNTTTDFTNGYSQNDSILYPSGNIPALIVTDNQETKGMDAEYGEFSNCFLPKVSNSKSMVLSSLIAHPKRSSFHIESLYQMKKSRSEPVSLDDENERYYNSPKIRTSINEIGADKREDCTTKALNDTKFNKIKRSISFIFLKTSTGKSNRDDAINESNGIESNAEKSTNNKEDEMLPFIYLQMDKKSFIEMVESMKVVKDSIDRLKAEFSSDDNNSSDIVHDLESFSLREDTNENASTGSTNKESAFWLTAENF